MIISINTECVRMCVCACGCACMFILVLQLVLLPYRDRQNVFPIFALVYLTFVWFVCFLVVLLLLLFSHSEILWIMNYTSESTIVSSGP